VRGGDPVASAGDFCSRSVWCSFWCCSRCLAMARRNQRPAEAAGFEERGEVPPRATRGRWQVRYQAGAVDGPRANDISLGRAFGAGHVPGQRMAASSRSWSAP
jgi:hypothetical protein